MTVRAGGSAASITWGPSDVGKMTSRVGVRVRVRVRGLGLG